MSKSVVILGGGVGGMSAAHELIERGFHVEVYERKAIAGGKARSVAVPNSAVGGRPALPGEHGFRFFPGFYRHLPDTMKRIPFGANKHGVLDNLVSTQIDMLTVTGKAPLYMLPRFPTSWADLKVMLKLPAEVKETGLTDDDLEFFFGKMWQILTSCDERRLNEYGRIGWWEFIEADQRSEAYRKYLAIGATRTLVASSAELANTRTVADIGWQLILNMAMPGQSSDRVLNGPTNEVFIDPWLAYLRKRGVDYHLEAVVDAIHCEGHKVTGVTVIENGAPRLVTADYYISALPVEIMAKLTGELVKGDPQFTLLDQLKDQVKWMTGIQFYVKKDVSISKGHQIYCDTAWALTSISQQQFWPKFPLGERGDGTVHGCISVDISDWDTKGGNGKAARHCTRKEIAEETWTQLKDSLKGSGVVLEDDNLHSWFLDDDIQNLPDNPHEEVNLEPLLVNLINSWDLRPDAYTRIKNLFLASDYVRTNTDLASMEGANEAARRAVNAILIASDSSHAHCEVWPLEEPDVIAPLRWLDRHRYQQGLQWSGVTDLIKPASWLGRIKDGIEGLLK
jgi:15-cis-phytoene desaturase